MIVGGIVGVVYTNVDGVVNTICVATLYADRDGIHMCHGVAVLL